jgi:glucokinase
LKREEKQVIGIDLGGTNFKIAVVTSDGRILAERVTPTPDGREWPDVQTALAENTRELLKESGLAATSVGFAAPGIVDEKREYIRLAPNFPTWKNLPLRAHLEKALKLPVILDNDVNAFGLAEALWGAGKGKRYLLGLAVGTGVGGAIILDGKLYRGMHGAAAELGHILLNENGPVCSCGKRGHLEAYLGRRAFDEMATRLFPTGELPAPKRMAELAAQGDERAREIHRYLAHYLALGCATLIHCFNPEAIVIGGGTVIDSPYLFDILRAEVKQHTIEAVNEGVEILPSGLGYMAGVLGAAALCFEAKN